MIMLYYYVFYVLLYYCLCFSRKKQLTTNEIADLLDEEFYNDEDNTDRAPIKIVMFPPKDKPGAESEGDSDDEDE